jgi:hypothetical protein
VREREELRDGELGERKEETYHSGYKLLEIKVRKVV